MIEQYQGWTITFGPMGYCATHDKYFNGETKDFQIDSSSISEIYLEIDEYTEMVREES